MAPGNQDCQQHRHGERIRQRVVAHGAGEVVQHAAGAFGAVHAPGDLHADHFVYKGFAATEPGQQQQGAYARYQQYQRLQPEADQAAPLAIEQVITAQDTGGDHQADRPANGEAQHQQGQQPEMSARCSKVIMGVGQVKGTETDGGEHLVQRYRTGFGDKGHAQQQQRHADQRPGSRLRRNQAIHQGHNRSAGKGRGQPCGEAGDFAEGQRQQPGDHCRGGAVIRIGLAVGGREKTGAVAQHFVGKHDKARIKADRCLLMVAQDKQQQGERAQHQRLPAQGEQGWGGESGRHVESP